MPPLDEPSPRPARPAFLTGREAMSIMDAIYSRRAVRDFSAEDVPETALHALLYAAVQAPTVVAGDVWGFAIVQDREVLKALSDHVGRQYNGVGDGEPGALPYHADTCFNIFFNAGTLVVIYGNALQTYAQADCWLAAENLMLAGCGMGIGSCIIGLAVDALNTSEWKTRLAIPPAMMAVAPIILGVPARGSDPVHRPAPNILSWTRS